MPIIDLRSDTITHPTPDMRQAMLVAEVGDDVFGEDPTVNRLEKTSAELTGKEAALFTPSGTMSNLIAVMIHTRHSDEIILGDRSHIFLNEAGGAAALGGVSFRTVPNQADGTIPIDSIMAAVRGKNIHWPETKMLCLENSHNFCGGAVLDIDYSAKAAETARHYGLKIHLDGARIFNAAIALDVPVSALCAPVDSVCFCLSKGLSAPVGSVLCGSADFIARGRKIRKMLGGGMRQAGIIAAAGINALETMTERLAEDHRNAKLLAEGLNEIPGIEVEIPATNIVMFRLSSGWNAHDFVNKAEAVGVKFIPIGSEQVRAVTHRMVKETGIREAITKVRKITADNS